MGGRVLAASDRGAWTGCQACDPGRSLGQVLAAQPLLTFAGLNADWVVMGQLEGDMWWIKEQNKNVQMSLFLNF